MGDRGSIAIEQGGERDRLYLYTHWGGSEVQHVLARALAKRKRWGDPAYLTRIVLNELQGDDRGDTGFGICVMHPCDDDGYPTPTLWWTPGGDLRIDYADGQFKPDEFIEAFDDTAAIDRLSSDLWRNDGRLLKEKLQQ
jgi:hypothetical protein